MSGLDSIALAVAHLEERHSNKNADTNSTSSLKSSSNDMNMTMNMTMNMNTSTNLSMNHSEASAPASVMPNHFVNSASPAMNVNVPSTHHMAASGRSLASFPPSPPPRALHVPPARVISMDEPSLTSASTTNSTTATGTAASSPNNNSNGSTFGYILADPIKWLQKTQDRPPLQPPSDLVLKVEPTDVLCGRGGETNHHLGNVQYRLLVKTFQPLYVSAKRRDKPLIAQCIVYSVRQVGGRFLKRANDKEWKDVGNTKAREKTSQALREGAPELRGDSVPKMMPKQKMLLPAAPPRLPSTATTVPGQAMSFVEARFISALLAQQAALTRSVVANQQHPQPPPAAGMPSHPMAPPAVANNAILPQPPEQQFQHHHYDHSQVQLYPPLPPPPQQQMLQLPLQQLPPQPPAASTTNTGKTRKRPAIVSDGHSDSDSIGSNSCSGNGGSRSTVGPRLKRFKMRFQQESSSGSA